MSTLEPLILPANQPLARPYRGGAGIARLRGIAQVDEFTPEDFVGSATEVHGSDGVGLTILPDGLTLRDAMRADPAGYFGEAHVAAFGADPRLLVKLLHTGERLFVHFHPDDLFATRHLGAPYGKTEAWFIADAEPESFAYLGFARDVSHDELAAWYRDQDVDAMLGAMHRIDIHAGDALFVPADLPHSIGPGITLVELQQPVDLSIVLEYAGFPIAAESTLLGLSVDAAVDVVDRRGWTAPELAALIRHPAPVPPNEIESIFPADADEFFRADRISVSGNLSLDAGFSILVVLDGSATLVACASRLDLVRGTTVLVPFGAGPVVLEGVADVIRCRPPLA